MNLPDPTIVETADEARDLAIDWQHWQADNPLYMSEVADYQAYFEQLANKFPELREEFEENAII